MRNSCVLAAALTDVTVLARGKTDKKIPVDRWAEQWAELVRDWTEKGFVANDVDPMFAGHLIVGMIRQGGAYAHRAGMDQTDMLEKLTRAIMRTLKSDT